MMSYQKQFRRPFSDLARHLTPFSKIIQDPLPPIEWIVESLIPHGTRTVIFGEYGSMKSWVLLHLSLHVAAGRNWFGRFIIERPRKVLYIDEEMATWEVRRRIKRLAVGAGLDAQDLPFQVASQLGERFKHDKVETLLKRLQDTGFDPDVIIVETLRRVLDGSENEATDVNEFWRSVSPILLEGKTFMVSHHMRKPNTSGWEDPSRHRASGSTDIMGGTDGAFAIKKPSDNKIEVECVKFRAGKTPDPFSIMMCDGEGEDEPITLHYTTLEEVVVPIKELDRAIQWILEYLATGACGEASTKQISEDLVGKGVKKRTIERALEECKQRGLVENVKKGLWKLKKEAA